MMMHTEQITNLFFIIIKIEIYYIEYETIILSLAIQ